MHILKGKFANLFAANHGETLLMSRRAILASGAFSGLLGLVVLVGWHIQNQTLIQVLPVFVPMQYNTALGFLLCGVGLLAVIIKPGKPAMAAGGIATLLGSLTLVQYIFKISLGIDQLFMTHYITLSTSHPGRMAPNTALCLVLTGVAIMFSGHPKPCPRRPLVIGILGSLILALGGVAFFGYLSGIETAYGWGHLTRMAVHTAAGFMALGIGVFICGWREEKLMGKGLPDWLAAPGGIALTAMALFQWQAMLAHQRGARELTYPLKESPMPWVILTAGILMALLLTLTIHLAQKSLARAKRLEKEIQARQQVQKEMQKSEEKYRLLADNTIDCIWRMNLELEFTYINPSVFATFGYTPGEWIGTQLKDHCSPKAYRFFKEEIDGIIKQPGLQTGMTFETQLLDIDDRLIPVEVNGILLVDRAGKAVEIQGTLRDISARKIAEQEKEKLEELLLQSQKMEALGTLAGGIAHDFNNILGIIIGYTELSLEEQKEGYNLENNLHQIMTSAKRAREMVLQILAFSRKADVLHVPVHLSRVVREALNLLRSSIPTTIDLHSDIHTRANTIMADPTQIHQVIMNLCANAAHAMRKEGGSLEISLETIQLTGGSPELKEMEPGLYEKLTVKDTGHGMDKETRKRIFEPYFTTKDKSEGTGMGLAMVHGIIKNHGGQIIVYSQPDEGTTFHIYLPNAMEQKEIPLEPATDESTVRGGNESILLIDDEQMLLEMQKNLIQRLGYKVTSRTGSVEALEAFKASPNKFHLVITDQTMPNMSGVQLARRIKKIRPEIPVILCTGFSETVNEDNFSSMGIDAFVLKPVLKNKIAPVIRKVLDNLTN